MRVYAAILALVLSAAVMAPTLSNAQSWDLPKHLETVPLPAQISFKKPSSNVPPEMADFLGAWGVEKRFHRSAILIVTNIRRNGRADLIYALGESPRFPVWFAKKRGKIVGNTLTFSEDNNTKIAFTKTGSSLQFRWTRGAQTVGAKFNRFELKK